MRSRHRGLLVADPSASSAPRAVSGKERCYRPGTENSAVCSSCHPTGSRQSVTPLARAITVTEQKQLHEETAEDKNPARRPISEGQKYPKPSLKITVSRGISPFPPRTRIDASLSFLPFFPRADVAASPVMYYLWLAGCPRNESDSSRLAEEIYSTPCMQTRGPALRRIPRVAGARPGSLRRPKRAPLVRPRGTDASPLQPHKSFSRILFDVRTTVCRSRRDSSD